MNHTILNPWQEDRIFSMIKCKLWRRKWNTEILKSNLCDYNDAYILVKSNIIVTAASATQVSFKNCASFTKCFTKLMEQK